MKTYQLGLGSFLMVLTCIMLAFVAVYERNRSDELEASSITVENSDVRTLIEQDLDLMKREGELLREMTEFENDWLLGGGDLNTLSRANLANLRNAKLKLVRERHMLNGIRTDILQREHD